MFVLRVQHRVPSFAQWQQAFDGDPLDRRASGVRRYSIHRSVTDPDLVMIDLEFDSVQEAERLLEGLHQLWSGAGAAVTRDPQAWIVETVDSQAL